MEDEDIDYNDIEEHPQFINQHGNHDSNPNKKSSNEIINHFKKYCLTNDTIPEGISLSTINAWAAHDQYIYKMMLNL